MILHVYALCYNEEVLLPYFLRHYSPLAERIVIFDGGSTDRSADIMAGFPKVVRVPSEVTPSHAGGQYSERILSGLRNEAYRASRGKADWVAIVDIDEILYHPDLAGLLERFTREGITLPKVAGYEMVADHPPRGSGQLYDEIRSGFSNPAYSKRALFHPSIDIRYDPGCHRCSPRGNVVESRTAEIRLLHCRFLGVDHFVAKYLARQNRIHPESVRKGWGTHLTVPGRNALQALYPSTPEDLARRYLESVKEQIMEVVVV